MYRPKRHHVFFANCLIILGDEKGVQESADENALLQPILSLFTVAGFIIILGSIRSYYSSAKVNKYKL